MKKYFALFVVYFLSSVVTWAARPGRPPRVPEQDSVCFDISTAPYENLHLCLFGMTQENRHRDAIGEGIGVAMVDVDKRKIVFCKRTQWVGYKSDALLFYFKDVVEPLILKPLERFPNSLSVEETGIISFRGKDLSYEKQSQSEDAELEAWLLDQPECRVR